MDNIDVIFAQYSFLRSSSVHALSWSESGCIQSQSSEQWNTPWMELHNPASCMFFGRRAVKTNKQKKQRTPKKSTRTLRFCRTLSRAQDRNQGPWRIQNSPGIIWIRIQHDYNLYTSTKLVMLTRYPFYTITFFVIRQDVILFLSRGLAPRSSN